MEVNKEVLKGNIDTILLSLLSKIPMYGYELAKSARTKSGGHFELKEGTMYLALKRLEQQTMVESYWEEESSGGGGRRKYYRITAEGENYYAQKRKEWQFVRAILDEFLKEDEENESN